MSADPDDEPRFTRPEPYIVPPDDLLGFAAGVLRVEWSQPAESFEITGRTGRMFTATIVECRTRTPSLKRDDVLTALIGIIVRDPDGRLCKIVGVDSHCTMRLGINAPLGLLLVPAEES